MSGVRRLSVAEAQSIAALHAACFGPEAWSAAQMEGSLNQRSTCGLAVYDHNKPLALLLMQMLEGGHEILTLGVHPAHRRTGLARMLIQTYREQFKPQGEIFLEVAADNAPAIALYESLGFEAFSRRKGYYARKGGAVDAINYRLVLKS